MITTAPTRTAAAPASTPVPVLRGTWAGWLLPGVLYVVTRVAATEVLGLLAAENHRSLRDLLHKWDGNWYLAVVRDGYGMHLTAANEFGQHGVANRFAFFPLYPYLVHWVTPVFAGHIVIAALAITGASGVAAAYALTALARRLALPPSAGWLLVVLFAASPTSVVLSMTYAEALFCALAAWALVALLDRRWLAAGVLACLVGATRPPGGIVIALVVAAACLELARRLPAGVRTRRAPRAAGTRVSGASPGWRVVVAILVAPAGLLAYLGYVGARTGRLFGYFTVQQAGWGTHIDGGVATATWMYTMFTGHHPVYAVGAAWLVLAAVIATVVLCVRHRLPWPILAYTAGVVALVVFTAGYGPTKTRELVAAFTLLIPLAARLARQHLSVATGATGLVALAGSWFAAYGLAVWPHAI